MATAPPRAAEQINVEELAASLPARAALVVRLMRRYALRHANFDLNPAAAGILLSVVDRPRRITELAELEGQAQPYVTKLVSDLEARGWVLRRRDEQDGRVVWVHVSEAGRSALAHTQQALAAVLTDRLSGLAGEDLQRLAAANEALLLLAENLQEVSGR